jgi:hypothetical protein
MSDGGKGSSPRPYSVRQEQFANNWDAIFSKKKVWQFKEGCGCYKCQSQLIDPNTMMPLNMSKFIVCPTCGNKRCPLATDHTMACTGSNEPGQPGSRYE